VTMAEDFFHRKAMLSLDLDIIDDNISVSDGIEKVNLDLKK